MIYLNTIIETFWTFLFNIIVAFISTMCSVPYTMVLNLLDSLAVNTYVASFYTVVNTYILPYVGWFSNLCPPTTWELIKFYVGFLAGLYGVVLVTHYVLKVLKLVKKVPLA